MTFVDGPGHHQDIGLWQSASRAFAGHPIGFRRKRFGPRDLGESREAGGRREGEELQSRRRLRVEVDNLPLQILDVRRLRRCRRNRKGRIRCGPGDRIEADIPLDPCSVDNHRKPLHPSRVREIEQMSAKPPDGQIAAGKARHRFHLGGVAQPRTHSGGHSQPSLESDDRLPSQNRPRTAIVRDELMDLASLGPER